MIIAAVLCIVIICMRRSHRKRITSPVHKEVLTTNVSVTANPSYDVTEANTVDHDHLCSMIGSPVTTYGVVNQPKSDDVTDHNLAEYGGINQPKSDYPDNKTTHQTSEGGYGVINQPS